MNLSKDVKVTMVKDASTSAGTAINSDSVDMAGFDGVMFMGQIDTANASNFANVAQSSDDSSFDDLAGSKVLSGDNDDTFLIDIYKPTDRYVRCEIDRGGANTAVGPIYAVQYGAHVKPTSHGTTINAETHISPAEGTA